MGVVLWKEEALKVKRQFPNVSAGLLTSPTLKSATCEANPKGFSIFPQLAYPQV
jgi:hypothetical protein